MFLAVIVLIFFIYLKRSSRKDTTAQSVEVAESSAGLYRLFSLLCCKLLTFMAPYFCGIEIKKRSSQSRKI